MRADTASAARFSHDYTHIIDSAGSRVELSDPRVVHVWPFHTNPYTSGLVQAVFAQWGWTMRVSGAVTKEVLRAARELCSGRECLPAAAITGSIYTDYLRRRAPGEITVYYNLDQDGPCQNGAWPVLWDTFARRIGARDAVLCSSLGTKTNYVGQGKKMEIRLSAAIALGDIMDEARHALSVVAADRETALEVYEEECRRVVAAARKGPRALDASVKKWTRAVAAIPRREDIGRVPRVLLFGGLNVMFVQEPIAKFFLDRGIVPKVVELSEGIAHVIAEPIVRYGYTRGALSPSRFYSLSWLLASLLRPGAWGRPAAEALGARLRLMVFDRAGKRFRRIMSATGLVYDVHAPYITVQELGGEVVTPSGFNETTTAVGRYLFAAASGVFDGLINVGTYNCQPAMNSQAVLRPLAAASDIPYAAVDLEGPWIGPSQARLLDAVAVQAVRVRRGKIPS